MTLVITSTNELSDENQPAMSVKNDQMFTACVRRTC